MDFEDLEKKAADPSNRLLLLCSPHNPVGRVWTPEELRRLMDICIANDVYVIADEIHNDLIMPGYKHTTLMKVLKPKEFDAVAVATAPSKTFNLAGLQCSNIFISDRRMRTLFQSEYQKFAIEDLNCFAYVACQAAYDECDGWLQELIEVVWSNYNIVKDWFEANWPQFEVFPLEGTYLAWVDLRACGKDHKEIERAMRDNHLYLDEGYIFSKPGRGFERINLACPASVIEEALPRMDAALKQLTKTF
jgi:cystathionine beta-lyase